MIAIYVIAIYVAFYINDKFRLVNFRTRDIFVGGDSLSMGGSTLELILFFHAHSYSHPYSHSHSSHLLILPFQLIRVHH